jgi:hypothetical protein
MTKVLKQLEIASAPVGNNEAVRLLELNAAIDAVNASIAALQTAMGGVASSATVSALQSAVGSLETNLASLQTAVGNVTGTDIPGINTAITALQTTVSSLQTTLAGMPNVEVLKLTGDGTATTFTLPHTFGDDEVVATMYEGATGAVVLADINVTSSNVVVEFGDAPANGVEYKVVLVG